MITANRIKTDNHADDVSSCQSAALLKQRIEALPSNQFVQAWTCIEEINAALNKAGPAAPLAAAYCRVMRGENTAKVAAGV